MFYVISWYDPDDPDQGTNTGVNKFDDEDQMLDWLRRMSPQSPRLEFEAYQVLKTVSVEPVQVATDWRIK